MKRFRPTPALVVACVALAVALGGVSYAATVLPRNSVGVLQLKPNSVNSSKVVNGSLLKADFKAGQIPTGPAGPAGTAGAAGPAGPAGPAGAAGAAAVKFWATLDASGALLKNSGVVSTSHIGPGLNQIKFSTSINDCAPTMSIFGTGATYGMMASALVANDTILIGTVNSAGTSTNLPIALHIMC